ncbi:MAG: T9SS type A sorting domain-containing protein [Ignavibacteriaceae bacterium]|nr:T9SS type A sorting domain-containing protein [Ignavibacteriaceae bacterium]
MTFHYRYLIISLTFIFLFSVSASAQEYSVHKEHSEAFGIKDNLPSEFDEKGAGIIPLQYDKSKMTGTIIYGYLPDWEYPSTRQYLRYDILTHIAAFDFTVSNTGAITNPSGWPWTDVINTAHANGVKVTLCAVNFEASDINTIMTNSTVKQTFFNNLKNRIQQYQLDGVNIDFEGLNQSDRGTVLNTFMADLKTFINTHFPGMEVSFAGPAITTNGWNVAGLANACDFIFIMGYAFYGSWSTTTGACAPLTGGTYNITNTVLTQYATVTNSNPQKLVLGVPYYGLRWTTQTQNPHSPVIAYINSTRFRDDALLVQQYGLLWATDNQVPWYRYQSGNTWYQVWYDDDSSLGLKYALAQSKNYAGVGMWALGYDGSRNELWDELYRRFYQQIPVELQSFTAVPEGFVVILKWITATELNNKEFIIERKSNSDNEMNSGWKVAGNITGRGTTTAPNDYVYFDAVTEPGEYTYRLKQIDLDGSHKYSQEINVTVSDSRSGIVLEQNYPNPFNNTTRIKYYLQDQGKESPNGVVTLKVFDVLGREVARLVDGTVATGVHQIDFSAVGLPSGFYSYELRTGKERIVRKMNVLR